MADVSIDATISTGTSRGKRAYVVVNDLTHYRFYVDNGEAFGYAKSSDGGATWGAFVDLSGAVSNFAFDVWYDRWTPNDTGTLIHCFYFDGGFDDAFWRSVDTGAGDALGTKRTIFNGITAASGRGAFISGTKALDGKLYCAYDLNTGTEKGLHRSTDGGTTWSASLSATFVEATLDECLLLPAANTGDPADILAVYLDTSATELTLKLWDSSGAVASESTVIQTHIPNASDLTGQTGFSATIKHADGKIWLVASSERDTATASCQVWELDCTGPGTFTITAKTAITTNIDDHYYPAIFIDQISGKLYVAYNGKRDGSETLGTATKVYYTSSSDGGLTWSIGDTAYMEGAAAAVVQVWTPLMGARFYVSWRVGTTLNGNAAKSVPIFFPARIILEDTFSRTLTGSVGSAEGGTDPSKAWQPGQVGTALSDFDVDGSRLTIPAATTANRPLAIGTVTTADVDLYMEINGFPSAGVFHTVIMMARFNPTTGDDYYDMRYHNDQDALDTSYFLQIYKIIGLNVASSFVIRQNQTRTDAPFAMRGQVQTFPDRVVVRLRKWPLGTLEPTTWTLTLTDFADDRLLSGNFGVMGNNGGVANSINWDNFTVQTLPTQTIVPNRDVAAGSWTTDAGLTTGLAAATADSLDGTYDKSSVNPVADTMKLALGSPGTPVGGNWALNVRSKKWIALPDLLDETFEGAGYAALNSTENIGAGSSLDPDYLTGNVGSPAGWGSQCLRANSVGTTTQARKNHVFGSPPTGNLYFRDEIIIRSESIVSGSQSEIFAAWNAAFTTPLFNINVRRDGTSFRFQLTYAKTTGTNVVVDGPLTLTTNVRYTNEIRYDLTGLVWEWRLNGATLASGPLTAPVSANGGFLVVGSDIFATGSQVMDIVHGKVGVSSQGFMGVSS